MAKGNNVGGFGRGTTSVAVADRSKLASLESAEAFWRRTLAGVPARIELQADRPGGVSRGVAIDRVSIGLDSNASQRLTVFAESRDIDRHTLALAAWSLLMHRLSGQTDFAIGSGGIDLSPAGLPAVVNASESVLPLRFEIAGDLSGDELLQHARRIRASAEAHRDFDIAPLLRAFVMSGGDIDPVRIQTAVIWRDSTPALGGALSAEFWSGFELGIEIAADESGMEAHLHYRTSRFERETAERYLRCWRTLLAAMAADPTARVGDLPILDDEEKRLILLDWNATDVDYPLELCAQHLFEAQATHAPDATALVFGTRRMRYAELNSNANRLAHLLRSHGVEHGSRIALILERGFAMVEAILATLKSGAAYVPIATDTPIERLRFMLDDTAPVLLISDIDRPEVEAMGVQVLRIGALVEALATQPDHNPGDAMSSSLPAYVIYTSGTSGAPKGVLVSHRNMVNFCFWCIDAGFAGSGVRMTQFAPYTFDASAGEIFAALLSGAELHLLDGALIQDPQRLQGYMKDQAIGFSALPPAYLQQMDPAIAPEGFHLLTAGSAPTAELAKAWASRGKYLNGYGPTETTILSTAADLSADQERITIGRPISNTRLYLLDARMQPVPIGVCGEIWIGGVGVALGYLNQPAMTAERFVDDPFAGEPGARMYRTGDLGRWLSDGTIEFIGRNDFQVKIRGFRIELGEIETALRACEGIDDALVLAREDGPGEKNLVAYCHSAVPLDTDAIRLRLARSLPDYMVPSAFVRIEVWPLNANGKIDRKALPAPDMAAYRRQAYAAPVGEIETELAAIWADALHVEPVGRDDNFFELGGHSLAAMGVIQAMRRRDLHAEVADIFAAANLAALAQRVVRGGDQYAVPSNLIPAGATRITPQMLSLISLGQEQIDAIAARVPGGAGNIQDIYPLSPLQQGMLFHHTMSEDGDLYLLSSLLGFGDRARLDVFLGALQKVIDRHDVLRTGIEWECLDAPVQVVHRSAQLIVEEARFDIAGGDVAGQLKACYAPTRCRLDLRKPPLLRLYAAEDPANGRWLLRMLGHHIAMDHMGYELMLTEVRAVERGELGALPPSVPYRNFVAQTRQQADAERDMAFFRGLLADIDEQTAPFGVTETRTTDAPPDIVTRDLASAQSAALRAHCRRLGIALSSIAHFAWALVLARTTGRDAVVFGTIVFGRMRAGEGADRALGLFINTLPCRIDIDERPLQRALKDVHAMLARLMTHEHAPLALAQRCSGVAGDNPLFSTLLNYRYGERHGPYGGNSGVDLLDDFEQTNYPITVSIDDFGDDIRLVANVRQGIDGRSVCDYLERALLGMLAELDRPEGRPSAMIDVMGAAERDLVLMRWNQTDADYPRDACIHHLFEAQAARTPDAVALIHRDERMTYAELDRHADRLAHLLRAHDVGPEARVGICAERCIGMVVAMLATLKAGGAYVPLDPAYPPQRLGLILDDSQPLVVLTDATGRPVLESATAHAECELRAAVLDLSAGMEHSFEVADTHHAADAVGPESTNLAYLIYTSGSTGRPKGVAIEHRNAVNFIFWAQREFSPEELRNCLFSTSINFDLSIFETFVPLSVGGTVTLAENALVLLNTALPVTLINTVPSVMVELTKAGAIPPSVRVINVAGEVLKRSLAEKILASPGVERLCNLYGPSETTTYSTWVSMDRETGFLADIGRPIANTRIYILDAYGRPTPADVVGEMFIGGDGVARSYLGKPEMTAERFLDDPFSTAQDARMYRTGDLTRWLPSGRVEYLGRNDFQVKIRGFRIELGEIETRLTACKDVYEAVVVACENVSGDKRLVAYYLSDAALPVGRLREWISDQLPAYMVPSQFVWLAVWPLTPNGKLDRNALPPLDPEANAVREYEAPQGPVEEAVALIWAELLRVERIGRQDNFFELGGHSLIAMTMVERLRKERLHSDIRVLFTASDLKSFAASLMQDAPERTRAPPNRVPDDAMRIVPEMLPLVDLVQADIDEIAARIEGGTANIREIYPLSPMQEGILYHRLLEQTGDIYHASVILTFRDLEQVADFAGVLQKVIDRHDILRTSIVWENLAHPVQVVQRSARLVCEALRTDPSAGSVRSQLAAQYDPASFRVDLSRAPLLRGCHAYDPQSGHWLMCLVFHHLVIDHASLETVVEEAALIAADRESELPPPAPFRNYIWRIRSNADQDAHQAFFTRMLAEVEHPTLPFGLTEYNADGSDFEEFDRVLPTALSLTLRQRARELGVSAAAIMHLAWGLVLARSTGLDRIVFGTVLFGRIDGGQDADRALGLFINTLPLRVDLNGLGVAEAIRNTHAALAALLHHEHASLAVVQRYSAVPSSVPLFTSLLNYRNASGRGHSRDAMRIETLQGGQRTHYPLALAIDDLGTDFGIGVQTMPVVGAARVCDFMQAAIIGLLDALNADANTPVLAIDVMPAAEFERTVGEWNRTARDYPLDRCAHALFEERTARTPEAIAIVFGEERIAYADLNAKANRLAHALRARGIGSGTMVAVSLQRGIDMIAVLLAVLKAGGVYIPMAVDAPAERVAFMLDDARPQLHLADAGAHLPDVVGVELVALETLWAQSKMQSDDNLDANQMSSSQPAYVIYTSGTTGLPKGVEVSHRNLVNFCCWCKDAGLVGEGRRMTQFAPYTFDASAGEIFASLLSGSELHLLDDATIQNPQRLQRYLVDQRIHFSALPPHYLQQMDPTLALPGFRLLTAGSAPTPELVRTWAGRGQYLNGYGPTETTILSTAGALSADEETISIGRPIANTAVYLLDERRRPAPIGVPGEIWIGGEGVTKRYLNREELTAERYLDDPFSGVAGARMYKTGDLGRWLPDGSIEFLGRNDFQVKIRGFRIELGEIESRLCGFEGVREAVVLARENGPGDKQLVAYYLSDRALDDAALRQHLALSLPEYMLPAALMPMAVWPLTANGKIDRNALPAPDDDAYARRPYEEPDCDTERGLAAIWSGLLGVERIGRHDSFFELGGHSLLAMQLVSRIRKIYGAELPLRSLFDAPTLAAMAERVDGADASMLYAIPAIERSGPLPLSAAQQRLWFLSQIEGASAAYHMGGALRMIGALDRGALERALRRIVARHESLRTRFIAIDSQPRQVISSESLATLGFHDLRDRVEGDARAQSCRTCFRDLFARPFELSAEPPLRIQLMRLEEQVYELHLVMHHIVSDGWSLGVMFRELSALYAAELNGDDDPLSPLPVQYADFAAWQHTWLEQGQSARQRAFWQRTLAHAPALLELPTDRPRPPVQDFAGGSVEIRLDSALVARLRAQAQRHGATLYMLFLASWAATLGRLANQDEVVVGSPIAGRNRAEIEPLIGFFVNTLALRIDMGSISTVADLIAHTRHQVIDAQAHQDLPFDQVVETVKPRRSTAHTPIFQTMLTLNNRPAGDLRMSGLDIVPIAIDTEVAQFDIALDLNEGQDEVVAVVNYASALFDRATAMRYAAYWRRSLTAMADADDRPVAMLPMLDEDERALVLDRWNRNGAAHRHDVCLHQVFEARAAQTPNAPALIGEDSPLSYRELNERANRLAHRLIAFGVGPDDRVAICLERGNDAVIAILGALKAGGAYVSIDLESPAARIAHVLEDSAPMVVLTRASIAEALPPIAHASAHVLLLECEDLSASPAYDPDARSHGLTPRHLAYVLYTSGSTGLPKGVLIEHASAVSRIAYAAEAYVLSPADRCLQFASLSFDASVMQIFSALHAGASLLMRGRALWSPEDVVNLIGRHRIALADVPPAYLQALLDPQAQRSMPELRTIVVGGEATLAESLRGLTFAQTIFNEYGPTEATITATSLAVHSAEQIAPDVAYLSIGRPIAETRIYILDRHLQPMPVGVIGEIFIGGIGVARGYHNRPQMTAERFLGDPYNPEHGARMYKTGDLARWLPEGTIEYVGRNDFQVKIRGFRIELGEIETRLGEIENVREAVVLAREDQPGQKRLVAYILADGSLDAASLRERLSKHLPDYMLPAAFVCMDYWPIATSGKLDRNALPVPGEDAYARTAYEPPQGPVERAIAEVWQSLLGVEKVGRRDHFFDLGGHSLVMLRMLKMLAVDGIDIAIQDVYTLGSVQRIAAAAGATTADPAAWLTRNGWAHALAERNGERILFLALADSKAMLAFKQIMLRAAPEQRPNRIVIVDDQAWVASQVDATPVKSEPQDEAYYRVHAGDSAAVLAKVGEALTRAQNAVREAELQSEYDFTAVHRETMSLPQRDSLHVLPIPGWWSESELRTAFVDNIRSQDMLRAVALTNSGRWQVLDPLAFRAEDVAFADLRGISHQAADAAFASIIDVLREAKSAARIGYAAAIVARDDCTHALALYGDHLLWDGQSFEGLVDGMIAAMSGRPPTASRRYRDFGVICAVAQDPALLRQIAKELDASGTAIAIAATTAAIAANADAPTHVVIATIPVADGVDVAEHAFGLFRRLVSRITKLERFGIVIPHHGRRLAERTFFGEVGLFLDKAATAVESTTTFEQAMSPVRTLQRHGVRYLDWARSGDPRVADTLPIPQDEVWFNYQLTDAAELDPAMVDYPALYNRMRALRGIGCEVYGVAGQIHMIFAYRGHNEEVADVKNIIESESGSLMEIGAQTESASAASVDDGQRAAPLSMIRGEPAIVVEKLWKRYVDIDVVKGISFAVPKGCCFGILGPNGAGKTSVLGMIEGIVPISSGRISIMGMDVATQIRQIQPKLGVQLQQTNYFQFLNVAELIAFYADFRAAASGKRKLVPAARLLERLDLGDKLKFKVEELSGGQKQRLSIALAMLADPEIIFLDEPTAALDPNSRRHTWEFIEELKQDRSRTIVLTTHYMEEAERLCDEILIMNKGEIVGQGDPASLIAELSATQQVRIKLETSAPGEEFALALGPNIDAIWDEFSDSLLIATGDVTDAMRQALALAEQRQIRIVGIQVDRLSLEDVFLNKTSKELEQ